MKITIDTKEDSPEDIRKAVAFLSSLADSSNSNIFENSDNNLRVVNTTTENNSESSEHVFVNMFGDTPVESPTVETPVIEVPTSSDLLSDNKEEDEEDKPSVMRYE